MAKIVYYGGDSDELRSVADALESGSHDICHADCILSAIELCVQEHPKLLILAERPGPLDALDFLKIKQTREELSDTPCLVVSKSIVHRVSYFELGCEAFIELPISAKEFTLRLNTILNRPDISSSNGGANGLSGSFEHASLVDLLQMLVAAGKNGTCQIETPNRSGTFYFEGGQVIHAVSDDEEGEDAFLSILRASQGEGRFTFCAEELPDIPTTIEKRTDHLLLGLASILDEESMS